MTAEFLRPITFKDVVDLFCNVMSVLFPRVKWIDLVGRAETLKPWKAPFKYYPKMSESWFAETDDIFINHEGLFGNQEGMIT